MAEKIKYGISKVHYAILTDENEWTYEKPVHIPGAVNLSLSAEGENSIFYADNIAYFVTMVNNGFTGDLEMALIPDQFKIDVLGYRLDEGTGMLLEVANANPKPIALMFQFETDEQARKVCLFKVTPSRPSMDHATKTENIEPQTDTITITSSAIKRGDLDLVKGTAKVGDTIYSTFYDAVPVPAEVNVGDETPPVDEG